MIIRPATKDDLAEIVSLLKLLLYLHQQIDREYYQTESDYIVKIQNWTEQHLSTASQFLLVAEDGGGSDKKICGFISGYIKYLFPWYKLKSVGHISFLAVNPDCQNRGVGKELENSAKNWFLERNLKYIEVYCHENNGLGLVAWKSYGFKPFNKFLRKKVSF